MKNAKSRLSGAIVLILAIAVLLTGIFAARAPEEGTPLNAAYAAAQSEKSALTAAQEAAVKAGEQLERAGKRSADAIKQAQECYEAAVAALETETAGDYDPETDVGLLGQSILEAESAGAERQGDAAHAGSIAAHGARFGLVPFDSLAGA